MSSLKDIMDVDVEPLESQAYRRSREAALQKASLPSIAPSSTTPSPSIEDDDNSNNNKGKAPIKRRRSNRVSKTTTPPPASRSNIPRRRSSATGEAMDFTPGYQTSGSNQASASGTPLQGSRVSDSGAEIPVKYTPVTGRISRAKKGVPVHTCEICAKTFTRAEHLRRHQLSHQKPAYACTFKDCERAFHRPDLLARHMHRHSETQGEGPYRDGDRSRASSSASESQTPSLKVEAPTPGSLLLNQISPTDSSTPRTSASGDTMTSTSFETVVPNFPPVNTYSPGSSAPPSNKRSASQAQLHESDSYMATSPPSTRRSVGFEQMNPGSFSRAITDLPNQNNFSRSTPSAFEELGFESGDGQSFNYTPPAPQLPLLRIPEESYIPSLSYTQDNSPWCSSASDSSFSNHSDGPRNGRQWRGQSPSVADWPVSAGPTQWSPHGIPTAPQDIRSPEFDPSILDQYETSYTSPRMTPPSRNQLLGVPSSYGGYTYMESVGTPALSTYNKPIAQLSSASPSRVSNAGLASINAPRAKTQLGRINANSTIITNYQAQPHLDTYLISYWQHFHSLFPIVHRPTFISNEDNHLLTSAMAAIGSQYQNTPEARTAGSELNELCRKSFDLCPTWNLKTMQAILLTEIFTLFRGRKPIVRLSKPFEALYRRLLESSGQDYVPTPCTSPGNAPSVESLLDRFVTQPNHQVHQSQDVQSEWLQWVDNEARQRLLGACFVFDVHQSIYHQQPRSKASRINPGHFYQPCFESLWNAGTSSEWQAQQSQSNNGPQQLQLIEHNPTPQSNFAGTPYSEILSVSSFANQLPTQEGSIYPTDRQLPHPGVVSLETLFPTSPLALTYLALNHTPLHDLLAIAGDTWIFGKKITPPSAFTDASQRLKIWSSSIAAAQATQHACRVLSLTLNCQPSCITDYWSVYVSVLICWAFGHRFQTISTGGSGTLSRNNSSSALSSMDDDGTQVQSADDVRLKALTYIEGMLALGVEDLLVNHTASLKGDTSGVIAAVRLRLELESVGGTCSLLVDCIGVLSKISKSGKGKWF
ncbi:Zinc finger protein klf1 [Lachnellula cervina]|uniref:Zinc finger protein klf1 n=1 Tax=Lachnellula cervina TaxID=1316786 RepID=A0A7D8UVN5_9HELO|nr:Zinc finger protein klf1 [Lachnellula cervina]